MNETTNNDGFLPGILPQEQLDRNFAEVDSGLSAIAAMEEANRCLYCYDAPCIRACPTRIPIPSFIKRIATSNLKGAAAAIMNANPVGASCSRVCPTEELCEGACVWNHTSQPIRIGLLQRYATDYAIAQGKPLFSPGKDCGKKVAIIGGGPAGLSAARELARAGFRVTIYEAKEEAGGLSTYGIVSFRLPQEVSLWEVEQVKQLGVEILTNTVVGKDISADQLLLDYDVLVLSAGMGSVPPLGIEGEGLEGVYDAIQLIEETKSGIPRIPLAGARVAVIGAGNTAIDAATCSVRLGAEQVKILYRRTKEQMTAYGFEYDFAKQEGVEFSWLTAPKRIIGDASGWVVQLVCVKMRLTGKIGRDGRPVTEEIPGSEFILPVDAVVFAIGQTRRTELIEAFGLRHEQGVVVVDEATGGTSNPRIFAAGDILFGGGAGEAMVVSAAEQGKRAAYGIIDSFAQRDESAVG